MRESESIAEIRDRHDQWHEKRIFIVSSPTRQIGGRMKTIAFLAGIWLGVFVTGTVLLYQNVKFRDKYVCEAKP